MGHDHEPGPRRERRLDVLGRDGPVLEREDGQPDAALPRVLLERPQHGVVLEGGREDAAARLCAREEALDKEVQGVGRVLGEDHVLGRARAEEAGDGLAGDGDRVLPKAAGGPTHPKGGRARDCWTASSTSGASAARRGVIQVDERSGGRHADPVF